MQGSIGQGGSSLWVRRRCPSAHVVLVTEPVPPPKASPEVSRPRRVYAHPPPQSEVIRAIIVEAYTRHQRDDATLSYRR